MPHPLDYAPAPRPLPARPALAKATRVLLALSALACLIAWMLIIIVDVESVLLTGPIILLLGVALAICAARLRFVEGMCLGSGHMFISLLFFALVNLLDWSPREATRPFLMMGAIYLGAMLPVTVFAWPRVPSPYPLGTCQCCGYPLCGLSEARCPECGTPFDPALLAALPAPPPR